jgi:hypothetical protein
VLGGVAEASDYFVHSATGQAQSAIGDCAADVEDLGGFRQAVALNVAEQKYLATTLS